MQLTQTRVKVRGQEKERIITFESDRTYRSRLIGVNKCCCEITKSRYDEHTQRRAPPFAIYTAMHDVACVCVWQIGNACTYTAHLRLVCTFLERGKNKSHPINNICCISLKARMKNHTWLSGLCCSLRPNDARL